MRMSIDRCQLSLGEKTKTETIKSACCRAHMLCAEIVNAISLKGHVVDPAQARTYRLVSNILNLLLQNGPNQARAIRLWHRVGPGEGGPIARTKQALTSLNISWSIDVQKQSFFGGEKLSEENKIKILHIVRDKLRRIAWRKAAVRRMNMAGMEDMNYERPSMLWRKKKGLNNHLQ